MPECDQPCSAAAPHSALLLRTGCIPSVRVFVAGCAPDLRDELAEYLELGLALGQAPPPQTLMVAEQDVMDRVTAHMRARLRATSTSRAPSGRLSTG